MNNLNTERVLVNFAKYQKVVVLGLTRTKLFIGPLNPIQCAYWVILGSGTPQVRVAISYQGSVNNLSNLYVTMFCEVDGGSGKVGCFRFENGPDPLSKGWGTCIKTSNYTWPGS